MRERVIEGEIDEDTGRERKREGEKQEWGERAR
jgi:hypothetical protein